MQSAPVQPRPATRTEELAQLIRLDIARNELRPGSRITEEALAERYGMSRTPVREALRVLVREALLRYRPHSGYLVAEVSLDAMDDLYTVRVAIEEQVAARLSLAASLEALAPLLVFWGRTPVPAEADVSLVFADEQFHESLAAASGSAVFPEMLRNINQRLHALRIRDFADPERVRRTFEQHHAILRALQARDARLARALLRAHIWESHSFVSSAAVAAGRPAT